MGMVVQVHYLKMSAYWLRFLVFALRTVPSMMQNLE